MKSSLKMPESLKVNFNNSVLLLHYLLTEKADPFIDFKKNRLVLYDDKEQMLLQFRFPLALNLSESVIKDKNLLNINVQSDCYYYIVLIQSGHAALGLFKNEKVVLHKVIRKYMTRQKQGRSQLNYLKTKGKSRAGSRIRLANTVSFFEEINKKLCEYFLDYPGKPVLYSCTPILWGMLFQSATKPPFKKKDNFLKKIPLDLRKPDFKILQYVAEVAMKGYLQFSEICPQALLNKIMVLVHSPIESPRLPIS